MCRQLLCTQNEHCTSSASMALNPPNASINILRSHNHAPGDPEFGNFLQYLRNKATAENGSLRIIFEESARR